LSPTRDIVLVGLLPSANNCTGILQLTTKAYLMDI